MQLYQLSFYQRRFLTLKYAKKPVCGRGSAPDPAGGAHDAPRPPSRLGEGDTLPRPLPSRHLRRLDLAPSALATRLLDFCPPLQKILAAPMNVSRRISGKYRYFVAGFVFRCTS